MNRGCLIFSVVALILAIMMGMYMIGLYNNLVAEDEKVKESWSNVENAYQRRNDLIGNLVATVSEAADFERGTLTDVIEARSKATSIQLNVDELTPENIAKYQEAQNQLNQAFLGRMNFLQENYPQLTATQQFRDLSASIEGTENRINVARNRYNATVREYNTMVRRFPTNTIAGMFGFTPKAPFEAEEGAEKAPDVRSEFDKGKE